MEINCIITGKVQNVAYRAYAQDSADALGVRGWVRNCGDGTVQVCAQGSPEVLKEYVEYLHEGSLCAEVRSVSVEWRTPQVLLSDFSITH